MAECSKHHAASNDEAPPPLEVDARAPETKAAYIGPEGIRISGGTKK